MRPLHVNVPQLLLAPAASLRAALRLIGGDKVNKRSEDVSDHCSFRKKRLDLPIYLPVHNHSPLCVMIKDVRKTHHNSKSQGAHDRAMQVSDPRLS